MARWLSIALVLALPCAAAAQETPHSRASCPEGSLLTSPPDGREVCTPQNCASDSDCGPGRICRDRPLCVETPMGSMTKSAITTCESGGKCIYPAECDETSRRCVRAGLVERYRTSCGCDVPGTGGGGGILALALASLGVLAHRRARRLRGV